MDRERITPRDEQHWLDLRKRDVTSTDCAAMMGLSVGSTYYALWMEKQCDIFRKKIDNTRMRAGRYLEDAAARFIANEYKLGTYRTVSEYIRLPRWKLGSSFDFSFTDEDCLFEIKTVDSWAFKQRWVHGDMINHMPPKIEWQVQHQMLVSGISKCKIGVLVGGSSPYVFTREYQQSAGDAIIEAADRFWNKEQPIPNYEVDHETICQIYGEVDKESEGSIDENLACKIQEYLDVKRQLTGLTAQKQALRAHLFEAIGKTAKLRGHGYVVSADLDSKGKRRLRIHCHGA